MNPATRWVIGCVGAYMIGIGYLLHDWATCKGGKR